ncbi:MAG TPA: zinc metallopeptidase [Verrucomicrobiota bacterium]|nr:zinc metallopeptidase [Verrucomicrobiota bacterium]
MIISTLSLFLFFGTMALALAAQMYVKSSFRRFSQVPARSGYTGAEVAAEILRRNGISNVEIHETPHTLADHYDPMHRRLVLSTPVFRGHSLSALGVAAHEAGHALQHKQAYFPLHLRMAAVGATNFASQIVMWLPILGMVTGMLATKTGLAIMAAGWGVIMLFNLITLPVEFDASARAKDMLARMGFLQTADERAGVAKVLNAAALTYVAAFITSLAYFLMYILPLLTGRSRD